MVPCTIRTGSKLRRGSTLGRALPNHSLSPKDATIGQAPRAVSVKEQTLEVDELLLLGGVLMLAMLVFAIRRG
ncbi:MAG TPA: hypothetical protein VHU43_08020 [Steroidobacteraceae bacterium]|jgi:hypothetical protein|nr:hypothetical protein [Steroidobacteraceae bacterium]